MAGRGKTAGSPPDQRLSDDPGVYRIRLSDLPVMAYIGECGNLARRIAGIWIRLNRYSPSQFGRREKVARRLAQLREFHDLEFEISCYAAVSTGRRDERLFEEQWRKGLEAYLLWKYRQETYTSTIANHGRATLLSGDQLGAAELGVGYPAQVRPSSPLLKPPENEPFSELWMGLNWTFPFRPGDLHQRRRPGAAKKELRESGTSVPVLWKALAPSTHELLKVGFTSRGSDGVRAAANRIPGQPRMAWTPLPRGLAQESYVSAELRNDLIGGYFEQKGEPPRHQFNPTPERSFPIKGYQLDFGRESGDFYPE